MSLEEILSLKSLIPNRHLLAQNPQQKHLKRRQPHPKTIIKTPARRQWHRSGVFIANPKHTPHTAPVSPLSTPNMQLPAGYLQLKLIL